MQGHLIKEMEKNQMYVMKPACSSDKNHHEHKLYFIREKLHTNLIIIENARGARSAKCDF